LNLLVLALAPVLIILIYVYIRDKYEKEPIWLLVKSLIAGAVITYPIILLEKYLISFVPEINTLADAAYTGFIVAAFSEELFKYIALFILIWRNKAFNEKFDGIVYAVFISLGFAAVENISYVFEYGQHAGISRAITAVPAHAFFGVAMGFYFGLAKFYPEKRTLLLVKSLFIPILLHGIYDFILMSGYTYALVIFVPFLFYLWKAGFKKMKNLSDQSRFK
jgi:RsiW-degrading membrane proteinase PrsW (M82 family)